MEEEKENQKIETQEEKTVSIDTLEKQKSFQKKKINPLYIVITS